MSVFKFLTKIDIIAIIFSNFNGILTGLEFKIWSLLGIFAIIFPLIFPRDFHYNFSMSIISLRFVFINLFMWSLVALIDLLEGNLKMYSLYFLKLLFINTFNASYVEQFFVARFLLIHYNEIKTNGRYIEIQCRFIIYSSGNF